MGLALVIGLLQGKQKGWSAISGGLTYWIPTAIFMWRVSAHTGARAAMKFMMAFFAGEFVKLMLSAVMFAMAVKYLSTDMLYGLIGLIGAILAFWIAATTCLLSNGGKTA